MRDILFSLIRLIMGVNLYRKSRQATEEEQRETMRVFLISLVLCLLGLVFPIFFSILLIYWIVSLYKYIRRDYDI